MYIKDKELLNSPVFSVSNKVVRVFWGFVYVVFIKYSPVFLFKWRVFILKLFGADISWASRIYPTARIWLPCNLKMSDGATVGPRVNVYNQGRIDIGPNAIISQDVSLCASTHDYNKPTHPLVLAPIRIESDVWVCAEAFIGPNVTLCIGSVIGARAVISKDTFAWGVYGGNPAVKINERNGYHLNDN